MRACVLVAFALAGCGQMYQQPAGDPPAPAADPTGSGPGGARLVGPSRGHEARASSDAAHRRPPAQTPAPPAAKPNPSAAGPRAPTPTAQRWLDAHNRFRAQHCARPLSWSPKLAEVAQKWADELQKKGCAFAHSPGGTYGENLAAGTSGALDPESTVFMWYDEVKKYDFARGAFSMETGHFTQVVWTTTTHVGCGQVTCKGNDILVCNYDPPGNWKGQFQRHVLAASCKK
jgi:pathogenesis-related protein 1